MIGRGFSFRKMERASSTAAFEGKPFCRGNRGVGAREAGQGGRRGVKIVRWAVIVGMTTVHPARGVLDRGGGCGAARGGTRCPYTGKPGAAGGGQGMERPAKGREGEISSDHGTQGKERGGEERRGKEKTVREGIIEGKCRTARDEGGGGGGEGKKEGGQRRVATAK